MCPHKEYEWVYLISNLILLENSQYGRVRYQSRDLLFSSQALRLLGHRGGYKGISGTFFFMFLLCYIYLCQLYIYILLVFLILSFLVFAVTIVYSLELFNILFLYNSC